MNFPTYQERKLSRAGKTYKKILPFWYPTKKHQRTEIPPVYANYRDYKPYLKDEFSGRCVYCRKADSGQDPGSFHVEHYKPKYLFSELVNVYINLFYACASCNRFKSNYWSAKKSKQVLNPCNHVMSQHLVFASELVEKRSSQGRLNMELLRLNNAEAVSYRRDAIDHTLLLVERVISLKGTKSETEQDWISRAVIMLSKLTHHSEEKIRIVLKV